MEILNLSASFVNDSAMDLNDSSFYEIIYDLLDNKIEEYSLIGNGAEICLKLLGDDTGAPISSIFGTFIHNGNEYELNIPNDERPMSVKIKLNHYDKDISAKIAIRNIESSFKAKNINIVSVIDKDYKWIFEVSFEGIEYKNSNYRNIKRKVNVFKEGGNHVYE